MLSDATRHVLRLAENEARRLGQGYVGTEHLLVAVLREEGNAGAKALAALGVGLDAARAALGVVPVEKGSELDVASPPRTPRAQRALLAAEDEAGPGSPAGPEHVLLALLRDEEGLSAEVLRELQVTAERVRAALEGRPVPAFVTATPAAPAAPQEARTRASAPGDLRPVPREAPPPRTAGDVEPADVGRTVQRSVVVATLLHCWHLLLWFVFGVPIPEGGEGGETGPVTPPGVRLDGEGRRVLALADREARQLRHLFIGTEHLLLGLVRAGDGPAARALGRLGVELHRVRLEVLRVASPPSDLPPPRRLELTSFAADVLRRATAEADADGRAAGTEAILIALLRQTDGVAAASLRSLGLTPSAVREQLRLGQRED